MKKKEIHFDNIREHFPALKRKIKGNMLTYFDGPGGTQVPRRVINAISNYYRYYNTNVHGQFQTSVETDRIIDDARNNIASFLGAQGPSTISVGQNMTTLNFALSRAYSRILLPGDEVVITQLDHEANRGPWLSLRSYGIKVREIKMTEQGTLDYEDLKNKISENTRNALGTVNDLRLARELTYKVGAYLLIDAVHYAPHFPINVQDIGMDFLLCSSYKFYGPHLGFLYSKPGILDQLPADRLRTQKQHAPYRIETGTLNHAALAGVNATIAFLSSLGTGNNKREKLLAGMNTINQHEQRLAKRLYKEILAIDKIKIIGPDFDQNQRAPTISFVHESLTAPEVCRVLADHNISAFDGHFYAQKAIEVLGLENRGGVTRIGISMYNNAEEIGKLITILNSL
jgi:cysteine desulfurase family protein (TIGR01976 family)